MFLSLYLKANNEKGGKFLQETYKVKLATLLKECELIPELAKLYNKKDNSAAKDTLAKAYDTVRKETQETNYSKFSSV
jgi:hypothetical protein